MEHKISKATIEAIWGANKGELIGVKLEDQGFPKLSVLIEFSGDSNPKNRVSLTSYVTQSGFLTPFNIDGEIKTISLDNDEVIVETLDQE